MGCTRANKRSTSFDRSGMCWADTMQQSHHSADLEQYSTMVVRCCVHMLHCDNLGTLGHAQGALM